ncbi:MAG: TIR domain-containing protein [Rhizobiaceae bacterium]
MDMQTVGPVGPGSAIATANADALKVFISYSRVDMAAADRMVADLERNGFAVTIDRRDLPYGEEWQKELAAFIAASDTVVWLVSPASVKSKWVNWELGEVGRLSKRLLPVKVADTDPATLPEALGRIHLLPAEGVYESSLHEADLVRALNTDRAWLKKATSLSDDAREWMAANRDGAHLLRGRALAEAEAWSVRTPRDVPAPASEILELILASRRGQDRRRRMTVVGSIAAAIIAIGLAVTAFLFQQRAEEQTEIAEEKTREAELGAARLAVNVAGSQLDQGETDAAAVLLLEAARSFDDAGAGDEMLIAFHRANQAYATSRAYDLPVGAVAYEGPDALYFVDRARGVVLRFDAAAAPMESYIAPAGSAPIETVGFVRAGDAVDLVVVHEDGRVVRVDAVTGATNFTGRMPPMEQATSAQRREGDIVVHGNGMIASAIYVVEADGDGRTVGRLLDTKTGAIVSQVFEYDMRYLVDADGSEFVYDGGPVFAEHFSAYRLVRGAGGIALDKATLQSTDYDRLVFRACMMDAALGPDAYPDAMIAGFADAYGSYRCAASGDAVLMSKFQSTSAGVDRSDYVLRADGSVTDVQELMQSFGREPQQTNFSWFGGDPETGQFGAILNRELLVFADYGVARTLAYPDAPGPARFVGARRIAVVEPWSNRVVVRSLVERPRPSLDDAAQAAIAGQRQRLRPLNPGSCVGYAMLEPYLEADFALPDGTTVDYADLEDGDDPQIVVMRGAGGEERSVDLGPGVDCAQFSRDGERMLVLGRDPQAVSLYDLRAIRAGAGLEDARLPAPEGFVTSAFIVGSGSAIVTTDATHSVLAWTRMPQGGGWASEIVYKGDNLVFHAEPSSDGQRLLILESLGAGDTFGFLYSVPARSRWIDLGGDYKWFGLAFGEDGAIASGARQVERVLRLPALSALVEETRLNLPARCRPAVADDWRTSPCWPAEL